MAVRLSRGECASRRNSNFFFEYLAPAETNVTSGGADSSLASFARCALFFFSIPRGIWTSNGVRRLLSTEIKNKSANRLPFANHDNEICQGTHYLDRFFKSYIAVAERSNREHLPLSLFFLEKIETGIILVDDTNLEQLFSRFYSNRDRGDSDVEIGIFFSLVCDGKLKFVEITHDRQSRRQHATRFCLASSVATCITC